MVSTRSKKRSYDDIDEGKEQDTTRNEMDMKKPSINNDADVLKYVEKLLKEAGIVETKTQGGWCLKEAMTYILKADNGRLLPLVEQHGAPKIFASTLHCKKSTGEGVGAKKEPKNCFESLCRIVAGQQLAGAAANAMWMRLLDTADGKLTPEKVLKLATKGIEEGLRKPSGLSNAKARSIVDIAQAFHKGELSETFLRKAEEQKIREELIKIKGIGPWSCDMFCMFFLELSDVFPVGDLGVRVGMKKHFNLKGSDKHGYLCQKKDIEKMENAVRPFSPYRSVVASYMWKVADTKDIYHSNTNSKSQSAKRRQK